MREGEGQSVRSLDSRPSHLRGSGRRVDRHSPITRRRIYDIGDTIADPRPRTSAVAGADPESQDAQTRQTAAAVAAYRWRRGIGNRHEHGQRDAHADRRQGQRPTAACRGVERMRMWTSSQQEDVL